MAKAKGTTLVGAVRFLRTHKERAREILPEHLHSFLEDRVLEARWYREEELHGLLEAVVALVPGPREQTLADLGAASARDHLEGVYAHLRGGRRATLSRRSIALWSSQHDTGSFTVEVPSDDEAIMIVRDFGYPTELMCGILGGYLAETLRLEGATDVVIEKQACVLRGDDECRWRRTGRRSE